MREKGKRKEEVKTCNECRSYFFLIFLTLFEWPFVPFGAKKKEKEKEE